MHFSALELANKLGGKIEGDTYVEISSPAKIEEAQKGNIIIGMPEALLHIPLRVWNIESNSEWKNGFRIYCTYKFDTSRKLLISVYDGKVSSISNW